MSDTPYPLGRVEHPETPLAMAAHPVTEHPDFKLTTRTSRYWWDSGTHLDQGQYGTCVGNAFAHRVADSPIPEGGITEWWAQKLYLETHGDNRDPKNVPSSDPIWDQGSSGLAACRVLRSRGDISAYVWAAGPDDFWNGLMEMGSWCIGIVWYNSMFNPVSEYGNSYLKVDKSSGIAGGHEVEVNGGNKGPKSGPPFGRIKNSWGTDWGTDGHARIALADLYDLIFTEGGDAVMITEIKGQTNL